MEGIPLLNYGTRKKLQRELSSGLGLLHSGTQSP